MAATGSSMKSAENGLNNAKHTSVVILDSDEEEEQTTSELFQGFITAVQPFLERKEILLLRVKFAEIRPEYASCPMFRELLRRKASQVHRTDVYIHFNDVLKTLISNTALYGRNAAKQHRDYELKSISECTSDAKTESNREDKIATVAGKFETDRQGAYHLTSKPETSAQSDDSGQIEVQIVDLDDQPSSQEFVPKHPITKKSKNLSEEVQQDNIRKQNRKKKIMKLERKLEYISNEIKRLSQSELSLEEMELADSNYMKESRLKEQFNKIWEKICMLKERPPDTGRVVEQEIKVKGTNFPAIDKAVRKFLRKKRGFPNIFDIRNIVIRANKKCGLGLTPSVVQEIAADVFTDIGNKIQKKRKKDYEYNFGCHLTDNCLSSLDPALNDNDLRRKLDENKKVSQSALEGIFQKYVHLDRIKGQENNDSTPCNSDYESSDDETYVRKKTKKRKSDSLDSSGSDLEKKAKRNKRQTATVGSTSEVNVPDIKPHLIPTSCNNNLVKPSCSGLSQSTLNTSRHKSIESIEIIDDDDEDLTVVSNQECISENNNSTCPSNPLNHPRSSNTNESSIELPTCNESLNHIDNTKSLLDTNMSTSVPKKPMSGINRSANLENLPGDSGELLINSNLSNGIEQAVNDNQNTGAELSVTGDDNFVINTMQRDQPQNTKTAENSLEMSESRTLSLDTSLKRNNSIPTSKVKLNTSKLHLKILQLRDKKLSDLSKTSNPKSKEEPNLTSSVTDSRCHKRKSASPHHIQDHVYVNGCNPLTSSQQSAVSGGKNAMNASVTKTSSSTSCNPSTSSQQPAFSDGKNAMNAKASENASVTKSNSSTSCNPSTSSQQPAFSDGKNAMYAKASENASVTKSSSSTINQDCTKQKFNTVEKLPLKDKSNCIQAQISKSIAKFLLANHPSDKIPVESVATETLPYCSRSPLNSAQSLESNSSKCPVGKDNSKRRLAGNSLHPRELPGNGAESGCQPSNPSKTSPIIILSDDED